MPAPSQGLLSLLLSTPAICDAPPKKGPRNVMLQSRRSVMARSLTQKYDPDWDNVLGEGAYGTVHIATNRATGQKCALKKISKKYTDSDSFRRETGALLRIHDGGGHPNVCGLRDMYEDRTHFYLILDLVQGGEMFEHLIEHGAYSEHDAARLMRDVASALAFLHGISIVHADLKPENLMLSSWDDKNAVIKMVDFGCAVLSDDFEFDALKDDESEPSSKHPSSSSPSPLSRTDAGTTAYWPPEAFKPNHDTNPAIDMWSLGVILYIMLTGLHPFDLSGVSTDDEIENKIKRNPSPTFNPRLTGHLSAPAKSLIKSLMDPDPEKRLSAQEMLRHPWIAGTGATKTKIVGSDTRLTRFKELQEKLQAGIFAMLVSAGGKASISSNTTVGGQPDRPRSEANNRIIERAFELMDADHKGFVSTDDMASVLTSVGGVELSDNERRHISDVASVSNRVTTSTKQKVDLSSFSNLMSSLKTSYHGKNQDIFREGEKGDVMYFINSGKVVVTLNGVKLGTLGQGDFFGEGSMLNPNTKRSATVTTVTPVEVMEITRADYERYVKNTGVAKSEMKLVRKSRMLKNAKSLIRLQTNVKDHHLPQNDVVFSKGDVGNSMYIVEDGQFDVSIDGVEVGKLTKGDMFGETALLMKRPRSATVTCKSNGGCDIVEMMGKDFLELLQTSPEAEDSLRDLSRRREFKKGLVKANRGKGSLKELFDNVDTDGDGTLSISEVKAIIMKFDRNFPEEEIMALIESMDLDGSGKISWKEFERVIGLGVR